MLIQIFLLALIQGITEFLPISSSAHLIIANHIFPLTLHKTGREIEVALHLGSLIAVVWYTRADIWRWIKGAGALLRLQAQPDLYFSLKFIPLTLPVVIAGALLNKWQPHPEYHIIWMGVNSILFGTLLGIADYYRQENRTFESLSISQLWILGGMQALALLPGVSRSGITITGALWMGLTRKQAAYISFLMSVPVILGALLLTFISSPLSLSNPLLLSTNILCAGISLLAIHIFFTWIQRVGYTVFMVYRIVLGFFLLFFIQ